MTTLQDQLSATLFQTKQLPVSRAWLSTFLTTSTSNRQIPLPALTQTALFRILNSDIRETLSTINPTSLLPRNITDPNTKETRLQGPIPLQVLDIEDIGSSLWSQVEAIERVERGEAVRGREIVRTVNVEGREEGLNGNNNGSGGNATGGPHRLTFQDAAGNRVVGIELHRIKEIGIGKLSIGAKVVVGNAVVARGVVLLTPDCARVLGGKIEAMDRVWKEGRKMRLKARVEEMESGELGINRNRNGDPMEE
ncbi:genome instability protein [Aspergillus sclerotialis]|uniref:RecQ-mediated genome instability protein 1 n=1 Tax=Aspergillus sclerotialis TaxID=2070753 RepID=A0A3A2ZEW4_9EURO|nr:genome instability protein [Aspergillus sclerotialis]